MQFRLKLQFTTTSTIIITDRDRLPHGHPNAYQRGNDTKSIYRDHVHHVRIRGYSCRVVRGRASCNHLDAEEEQEA